MNWEGEVFLEKAPSPLSSDSAPIPYTHKDLP